MVVFQQFILIDRSDSCVLPAESRQPSRSHRVIRLTFGTVFQQIYLVRFLDGNRWQPIAIGSLDDGVQGSDEVGCNRMACCIRISTVRRGF
jgi:hypothetical protein